MPANLTPEYMKAEEDYRKAQTPEEKLEHLQLMLRVIPKHKGTDKLQGDIKRRIARMRESVARHSRKKGPSHRVRPEGAGQVMLAGPPNSGKSSLLAAMTHAHPEIADYPCTTREPVPGMLDFKGVHIQFVDLPPVWREHCESFVFDNIKACDGVVVVIDLAAEDPVRDYRETLALLEEKHVRLVPVREDPPDRDAPREDTESLLVLNKADLDPGGEMAGLVSRMIGVRPGLHVVSGRDGTGLQELAAGIFRMLHVIRVYTRETGKSTEATEPFTVPVGATVLDFAARVHKDFAANLKSARVWGSAKFDGQSVHRDHVLRDHDIVELSLAKG